MTLKWKSWPYLALAAVAAVLVAVGAVWIYRAVSQEDLALSQPNRSALWAVYAKRALTEADAAGIVTTEPAEVDKIEAYNVTNQEIVGLIEIKDIVPVMVVRAQMRQFSDRERDGFILWATAVPVQDGNAKPSLRLGEREHQLKRSLFGPGGYWFCEELALRKPLSATSGQVSVPRPAETSVRTWTEHDDAGSKFLPTVSPLPLFQADWFQRGRWVGTVALFASAADSERAQLSFIER